MPIHLVNARSLFKFLTSILKYSKGVRYQIGVYRVRHNIGHHLKSCYTSLPLANKYCMPFIYFDFLVIDVIMFIVKFGQLVCLYLLLQLIL